MLSSYKVLLLCALKCNNHILGLNICLHPSGSVFSQLHTHEHKCNLLSGRWVAELSYSPKPASLSVEEASTASGEEPNDHTHISCNTFITSSSPTGNKWVVTSPQQDGVSFSRCDPVQDFVVMTMQRLHTDVPEVTAAKKASSYVFPLFLCQNGVLMAEVASETKLIYFHRPSHFLAPLKTAIFCTAGFC